MIGNRTREILDESMPEEQPITRELTVEEAIQVAILLQKNDQLVEADAVYRRVLEMAPNHPDALHYSGVLAHQQGRIDDAIRLVEKSLQVQPEYADWHSNLGIMLQAQGKLEEAGVAYRRAIALNPEHANAHSNLGVILRLTGHPEESEAAYRKAIAIYPQHIDAYHNLGILLNGLKRTQEAVECFCKVIVLRPHHPEARRMLALAHCALGQVDEAIKIFKEWVAEEPDNPIAQHMYAACTGDNVPERASDRFVERTFDTFAQSFETKLAILHYRAPKLVAVMVEDAWPSPAATLDVLDAGCGTGLCGPLIREHARTLTGIDLSDGMLAQAREKAIYDLLIKAELTEFLQTHPASYDLIVSADTLCYFGRLDVVCRAAADALRSGGRFVFTVEHEKERTGEPGFYLKLHGRYSHARDYIDRLLREVGLTPEIAESDLRMESGVPVAGLVVRATKAAVSEGHDA